MKPYRFLLLFIAILFTLNGNAQQGWVLKLNKDGIKVYTKTCAGTSVKAIKAECELTASLTAMTAVLLNVDNSKEWIYATKKVSLLERPSATEVIYYSEVGLPWPVSNRDFIICLSVTQDPITKIVRAVSSNKAGYLPRCRDIVRVEQAASQWLITPLANGRLHVEYELQVDPGGTVPAWLVNMFATTGPFSTFQKLRGQVEKPEYKEAQLAFISQ